MCNFLSALVLQNGDVLVDPEHTDSHEHLVAHWKLDDSREYARRWVRVEFMPPDYMKIDEPDTYVLKLDETTSPVWWTDELQAKVAEDLRSLVRRMLVTDTQDILLGGCWILAGKANITKAVSARIVAMCDSSKVGTMRGSSKVETMCDSSKVGTMRGSSNVGTMRGSSNVGMMCDSSKVGMMRDSSKVGTMRDSSNVGMMYSSSNVGTMCGSSNVGTMCDSANVGMMCDSSKVGMMRGSSKVGMMRGSSNVGMMYGSSNVGMMYSSSNVGMMYGSSNAPKSPTVDNRTPPASGSGGEGTETKG